jgi:hypothetical protein
MGTTCSARTCCRWITLLPQATLLESQPLRERVEQVLKDFTDIRGSRILWNTTRIRPQRAVGANIQL